MALTPLSGILIVGSRVIIASKLVCVLIKGIYISMNRLIGKVKNGRWIDGISHESCLEVKVRTGGTPGVATESDGVSGFDILVRLNEEF